MRLMVFLLGLAACEGKEEATEASTEETKSTEATVEAPTVNKVPVSTNTTEAAKTTDKTEANATTNYK